MTRQSELKPAGNHRTLTLARVSMPSGTTLDTAVGWRFRSQIDLLRA